MATTEVFTVSYIDVNPETDAANFDITQLDSWNLAPGIANMILKGAGEVDPTYVSQGSITPVLSCGTSQIKDILDSVGIDGMQIDAGTDPGVVAYLKQLAEGLTRKTGSNHMSLTVKEGMFLPRTITAAQAGGPAIVNCDIVATWDGTNAPIVIAASQAIGITPAATVAWGVGPVSVNGVALSGVQSITIDFGLTEIVRIGDGEVYPSFSALMARNPRVSIVTDKTSYLATLGIDGVAQSATDSVIYLRKCAAGGTRVADNVAEHIKFTIDDGIIQPGTSNYALDQAGATTFDIVPVFDGSNAIFVIDTTSAIT